jgi:sulfoxide reductase heme-binding subunit YedZ
MLGLFAFFYGLHFTTFLWFDHFFDVQECGKMLKRPFITVGFIAFVLLIRWRRAPTA